MAKKNHLARIKRNYPMLKALEKASYQQRKMILKESGSDLIKTLCDISQNIARGNIPMHEHQRKKLTKSKKHFRRLANKNVAIKRKHRELIQKGGFLSAIIPAISIVTSLLGGLLSK